MEQFQGPFWKAWGLNVNLKAKKELRRRFWTFSITFLKRMLFPNLARMCFWLNLKA